MVFQKAMVVQQLVSILNFSSFSPYSQGKFTHENISRTIAFKLGVLQIDPQRLKYLDQCHFISKTLWRKLVLSPVNERVFAVRDNTLDTAGRGSLSLATSISQPGPMFNACFNTDANSSDHFFRWFLELIRTGFVRSGDTVGMAPIHVQPNTLGAILDLCGNFRLGDFDLSSTILFTRIQRVVST